MFTKKNIILLSIALAALMTLIVLSQPQQPTQPRNTTNVATPSTSVDTEPRHEDLREIRHADWTLVLRDLVLSHPHPDVREGFNQAVESGELNFVITDDGEMLNDSSVAVFTVLPGQDGTVMRGMQIDIGTVMNPAISAEFIQLVLLHEYQHYLQSLRPEARLELMMPKTDASIEQESPADVRMLISNEMEAYTIECQFAVEQGWLWAFDVCQIYAQTGSSGLRRALVSEYMRQPVWTTHRATLQQILEEE